MNFINLKKENKDFQTGKHLKKFFHKEKTCY